MNFFSKPGKKMYEQTRLIIFLIVTFFGFGVSAFTSPFGNPLDWNNQGPINVTDTNQIKNGGLSVNTFTARGNAQFLQKTAFRGLVRGGTAINSTVSFGGISNEVGVNVLGDVQTTGEFRIDDLKHSSSQPKKLCADAVGKLVFCP